MVLSWLTNSLCKKIDFSILYMTTAAEVWKDLHERFSQSNRPRVFQLQKALSIHSQRNSYVIVYFTELKIIWDELLSFKQMPSFDLWHYKLGHLSYSRLLLLNKSMVDIKISNTQP